MPLSSGSLCMGSSNHQPMCNGIPMSNGPTQRTIADPARWPALLWWPSTKRSCRSCWFHLGLSFPWTKVYPGSKIIIGLEYIGVMFTNLVIRLSGGPPDVITHSYCLYKEKSMSHPSRTASNSPWASNLQKTLQEFGDPWPRWLPSPLW